MLAEILVAVVVDGRVVDGSTPARLRSGIVVAPLDPYVRRLADRIETTGPDGRITIVRGETSISLIPIAPFVRGGEPNIPLAVTARALGAVVSYDGRAHVVYVRLPRAPLSRMTPFARYEPPTAPVTFSPTATPAPATVVTGVPRPRRTPILVQSPM